MLSRRHIGRFICLGRVCNWGLDEYPRPFGAKVGGWSCVASVPGAYMPHKIGAESGGPETGEVGIVPLEAFADAGEDGEDV